MAFKPIVPLLEYFIRYDYIITELCENRDKPQLQCNGKCHLNKELAESSSSDDQKKENIKLFNGLSVPAILPVEIEFQLSSTKETTTAPCFYYLEDQSEYIYAIDNPPRLLSF